MDFIRKIDENPLRFEKKTLKPARKPSLSKIVHIFVIVDFQLQDKVFQLPLKVNSTVEAFLSVQIIFFALGISVKSIVLKRVILQCEISLPVKVSELRITLKYATVT